MKKNKCPVIFLVVFLLFSTGSVFGFTGGQLADKCNASFKSNPNEQDAGKVLELALDSGSCAGFVGGVIQGVNLVGSMLRKQGATKKNFICLPPGVHARDLTKIILDHYKKNPADVKAPAQIGIFNVFTKKYPCQQEK